MGNNVFAEGMGLFHKKSNGMGVAQGDVCLSPPPNAPASVPYVNVLNAKDLKKGSKSVKIQGKPTALLNKSEIAISTGDEPGTQGGGIITHKTKGKGVFLRGSNNIKAEGKEVCCNGDPMGQNNAAAAPLNATDVSAQVNMSKSGDESACETLRICFMPRSKKIKMNEFIRQLKLQEAGMNRMNPNKMLSNRRNYLKNPKAMRTLSKPLQKQAREEYRESMAISFMVKYGRSWKKKLNDHMETVAALHNPDMVVGGSYDSVTDKKLRLTDRIGGTRENSSLGSQWKSRAQLIESHAEKQAKNGCPSVQVELEVCKSKPGQPGVPA